MSTAKQAIMPVLLDSDTAGAQFLGDIKPGKYSYLGIVIDGTAAAADALVETEIGRIRVSEQGRDVVNIEAENMLAINRLEGGNARLDNAPGGDAEVAILIPRGYDDANVHLVTESDLAKVQINHDAAFVTAMSTGAGVATIELYGLQVETGEMNYLLKIIQLDELIAVSATQKIKITEENVFALYIENNVDWDRYRVLRDGEEAVNCTRLAATHFGDMLNPTDSLADAASQGDGDIVSILTPLRLANPGQIGEFLSDNIQLEVTSNAADTFRVIVMSADFAPEKLRQTKVETASIMERKLARKEKLGRSRPIQALRVQGE